MNIINNMKSIITNYILVDIETTGLSFHKDEIVELSAIKVIDNKIDTTFSHLVKPHYKIPYYATKIHGITNDMVKNANPIESILPDFIDFIANEILVAHNANFDLSFLQRDILINLNTKFTPKYIDTVPLARKYLDLPHYNLKTIAQYYNIDTYGNHRGLKDCMILYECFERLNKYNKTQIYEFEFKTKIENIDSSLLKVQTKLF